MSVSSTATVLYYTLKRDGTNVTTATNGISTETGNVIMLVCMLVAVAIAVGIIIYIVLSPRGISCCACPIECCGEYPESTYTKKLAIV